MRPFQLSSSLAVVCFCETLDAVKPFNSFSLSKHSSLFSEGLHVACVA